MRKTIRVLGTGGTIAGMAPQGAADSDYRAGQVPVQDLLDPLRAALAGRLDDIDAVQVAQIDSRDMSHELWRRLAVELQAGLDDPGVVGQVVTHGTDTLEETAVFLQAVLVGHKPVVLTAAMRPATSHEADGPLHLSQALCLAADPVARGVLLAFGGCAWPGVQVRKTHPFALQALSGGDGPPLAHWQDGGWRWVATPAGGAAPEAQGWTGDAGVTRAASWVPEVPALHLPEDVREWPRVEIVSSHAGAAGDAVRALLDDPHCARPVRGLVISATGNGSIHAALDAALKAAVRTGRLGQQDILVATRCIDGWIVGRPDHSWPVAARATPAQARVALMLQLAARAAV